MHVRHHQTALYQFWWHACETSPNRIISVSMVWMWDITTLHYINFDGMHVRHHQTALYQSQWHAYETSPNHIISVLVARIWGMTKSHYMSFGGVHMRNHHTTSVLVVCICNNSTSALCQFWWLTYVYRVVGNL